MYPTKTKKEINPKENSAVLKEESCRKAHTIDWSIIMVVKENNEQHCFL